MRTDHDRDTICPALLSHTVISSSSWSLWLHTLVYWGAQGHDPPTVGRRPVLDGWSKKWNILSARVQECQRRLYQRFKANRSCLKCHLFCSISHNLTPYPIYLLAEMHTSAFTHMHTHTRTHTRTHAHTLYRKHNEGMCGCRSFISCQKDVSSSSLWGREKRGPSHTCTFKTGPPVTCSDEYTCVHLCDRDSVSLTP